MEYSYKVLKRGFIDGVLRDPGGKHDPYVVDAKLDPCPSWLEEIKGTPKKRVTRKKSTAPQPDDFQGKVATQDVEFKDNLEVL